MFKAIDKPIEQLKAKVLDYILDVDNWLHYFFILLKIVIIIVAGQIIIKLFNRVKKHVIAAREKSRLNTDPRRYRTLSKLLTNVITTTVNFVVILLVLDQLGIPLTPFIASAGVVGLAVAFAAQNLVRDVITGFFIIFEDQFAVGDTVQIGSIKGVVKEIGLRTTIIKNWTGEIHIVPNGSIGQVTNFSLHNALAVVDYTVSNDIDFEVATAVIRETTHQLFEEHEQIVKEPTILGVQSIAGTSVVLRITAECLPNTQEEVTRLLNEHIKKALDAKKNE